MMAEARRELEARVEEVRQRLRAVERSFPAPGHAQPAPSLHQQRQEVSQVRRELQSTAWRGETARVRWLTSLRPGDRVHVRGISQPLEVLSNPDGVTGVEVALGSMRIRVSLDEIERKVEAAAPRQGNRHCRQVPPPSKRPPTATSTSGAFAWPMPLDRLDQFLDKAALAGLSSVRLVHGVGTGALRSALRERLAGHVLVGSFASEEGNRNDGATVVELA